MTRMLDHDERLRTRAFQFVDCLPSLTTNASLFRHLREYLDPVMTSFPPLAAAMLQPGPLCRLREALIGRAARWGATQMAGRFITGFDPPSLLRTIERLRRERMTFTLDVLGESTTSEARADEYAHVYADLMNSLAARAADWPEDPLIDRDNRGPMPRVNVSIKPTGLDPHFDPIDPDRALAVVRRRLLPLFRQARRLGVFVNVDMESFKHRDLTLAIFQNLLMEDEFRDWSDVGLALQAYLTDTEKTLTDLLDWGRRRGTRFGIRLVKGAYWDAETAAAVRGYRTPPVWTRKWETDACYERMSRTMLANTDLIYPAFASHNVRSLSVALATAEALGVPRSGFEVQMLYGMGDPLKHALAAMGCCVRVYCPYGDLMPGMGYLIRRLLENTSNEGFLKQGFSHGASHDRLLADPALLRPPSAPLPARYYQNTDPEEPMSSFTNAANTNFADAENRRRLADEIARVRSQQDEHYPLLIAGENVTTDAWFSSVNPSHKQETVGRVAQAGLPEADRAVAAARKAFAQWGKSPAATRADLLRKVADRLEAERFTLAATIVVEVGKPWREADADVTEAIDHWRYYADQIERIAARPRLRNLPGEDNMLTYAPKGVCAVVAPWAFPLAILSGMTSAALAAGNTVVIKPARQASVVAARLASIMQQVGFPPGVFSYLPGEGAVIGQHLVEHPEVNIVAFTGSLEVGQQVMRAGTRLGPHQSFIRKLIVEMGGNNPIIVDDDADLDAAVQAITESAFAFAGQKCSSCSRAIVLRGVYDQLAHRLEGAVRSLPIGPADQPSMVVGPVIDEPARRRILEAIEKEKKAGTVSGGIIQAELPASCTDGFFVPPTILLGVDIRASLVKEETFGPVLAVIPADSFEEALRIANNSPFALTGGVFSRSPDHIRMSRLDFAVGNLYINRRITGSQVDTQPFGGYKLSGTGVKAGSPDYLHHYMDARCLTENTLRSGLVPNEAPVQVSS